MLLKVVKIQDSTDEFEAPVDISISIKATVSDLQASIASNAAISLPASEQRLFFSPTQNLNISTNVVELSSQENQGKILNKDFGTVVRQLASTKAHHWLIIG